MSATYETRPGVRYSLGATPFPDGVNFSVFSRHATSVELLLYDDARSPAPFQVIGLDPDVHRTFFAWHVFVVGLPVGTWYTWRVDGPGDTAATGFRFDKAQELVDPYARAVTDDLWDRRAAIARTAGPHRSMRAVVVDDAYDWDGDEPLNHALEDAVIYELHVGGFTRHESAGVTHPGTFAGVIDKIPYLKALGITDVELMPAMAFDTQDAPEGVLARGLHNFWGYSTHSFFSPHPGYCVAPERGAHRREFRDMVKAMHQAGIGVFMDVVFNHTAEGGADGPTINFKGLGNEFAYHLDPADRRRYLDYTGCGNTVNCNHPFMARFIVDSLEYWVREMHVDGFRFDLASVLARGEDGEPMYNATVPWSIEFSDALAHTRLIAEAWDAGGLYQVGGFPGFRWAEWNGRYRDVIRRFVRGDPDVVAEVATRVTGSSDLYGSAGRLPINSINFITCHDGFTLRDLTSYDHKHNEANGEDNRDGYNDNLSWNCGVEGETSDAEVLALRRRQAKNYLAILLMSLGVPMILAGDEVLRTQKGNNNTWCQDNELGWFDWGLTDRHGEMLRFAREMIALRKRHPCLRRRRFLTGRPVGPDKLPDVTWHGQRLAQPHWEDGSCRLLAYTLAGLSESEEPLHIMSNMGRSAVQMPLPELSGRRWHRAVDTALTAPEDIFPPGGDQPALTGDYLIQPRSVVVLEGRRSG
jgi:isoamylase